MYQSQIDCTGCKHRPSLADAQVGDAYCVKFHTMPQGGNCMQHSQYDAARQAGDEYQAKVKAGVPRHLASDHPFENSATRSGTYLHLERPVVPMAQMTAAPVSL